MGRIVKKKKRKLRFSIVLFIISAIAYLATSLIVNTQNASLTMKIQTMNEELAILQTQNQTLNYEIQNLENKDRVYEIAQTNNMSQITDNIISIIGE